MIPKASTDLHGYKAWRNSLVPLEVGTVLEWIGTEKLAGSTQAGDFKPGQFVVVKKLRAPYAGKQSTSVADKVYDLTRCTRTGKEYERQLHLTVEGIATFLDEGKIRIIPW